MEFLDWGTPIGMGAFFAGLGVLFWGIYCLSRSGKARDESE